MKLKKFKIFSASLVQRENKKEKDIYVLSDETPKLKDWVKHGVLDIIYQVNQDNYEATIHNKSKLIVATTDDLQIEFDCPDGIEGCEVLHFKVIPGVSDNLISKVFEKFFLHNTKEFNEIFSWVDDEENLIVDDKNTIEFFLLKEERKIDNYVSTKYHEEILQLYLSDLTVVSIETWFKQSSVNKKETKLVSPGKPLKTFYKSEEVVELFREFERERSRFYPEDASEILPLDVFLENKGLLF